MSPNVSRGDYPDRLYLPDHLVFAGPEQMTRILADLGLKVVLVDPVRVDGPLYTLKAIVKSVVDGRPQLRLPWASPFRQVHYKATLERLIPECREGWSGQRESNPHEKLGKLSGYHYIMPAEPGAVLGRAADRMPSTV